MNDQVLVVRLTCLVPAKERQRIHEQILNQMATGCVILLPGTEAILVPKNVEIKVEEASNGAEEKDR